MSSRASRRTSLARQARVLANHDPCTYIRLLQSKGIIVGVRSLVTDFDA